MYVKFRKLSLNERAPENNIVLLLASEVKRTLENSFQKPGKCKFMYSKTLL